MYTCHMMCVITHVHTSVPITSSITCFDSITEDKIGALSLSGEQCHCTYLLIYPGHDAVGEKVNTT